MKKNHLIFNKLEYIFEIIFENYKNEFENFGITEDVLKATQAKTKEYDTASNLLVVYIDVGLNLKSERKRLKIAILQSVAIIKLHYKMSFKAGTVDYKYATTTNFHAMSETELPEKCIRFADYTLQRLTMFKQKDSVVEAVEILKADITAYKNVLEEFKTHKSHKINANKEVKRLHDEIVEEMRPYMHLAKYVSKDNKALNEQFMLTKALYPKPKRKIKNAAKEENSGSEE